MKRISLQVNPLEAREVPAGLSLPEAAAVASPILHDAAAGAVGYPLLTQPRGRFAVASGPGQETQVNVYDAETNALIGTVTPFGRGFTHGGRVATADLTGDGVEDIVVAVGPGAAPWVRVLDGVTLNLVREFLAYSDSFRGGVYVAVGDVTGDGRADIVTGAGAGGGPHVKVFDGTELMPGSDPEPASQLGFYAYSPSFHGGVSVAVGDVDADGVGDIVTGAGPGGGPHVKAFRASDLAVLASFFAYDPGMTRGVYVAAGDTNGDGRAEIATGPMDGGGPHVRMFDGGVPVADSIPFDAGQRVGARVAFRDLDGDGRAEVIAATGAGVPPRVRVLGDAEREFPAMLPNYTGGLSVG
jgi:hypothetical protein